MPECVTSLKSIRLAAAHKATCCHPGVVAGRLRVAMAGRPCFYFAGSCYTKAAVILFINSNLPLEH